MTKKAMTTAERQARWRAEWRDLGYTLVQVLVHRDDKERLQRYAFRLRDQREKAKT